MEERPNRVQWVYAAKNNRELEARYDEWAEEYERDLLEEFEWLAPRETVGLFTKYVAREARILDAGVGTGLVGESLIDAGYRDLQGIDLSAGMLDIARSKSIYGALQQMTLGESLDYANDTFDAVISVGVFTTGHAPAHAFDELVRITKHGGHIVFSLRTDTHAQQDFGPYLTGLGSRGKMAPGRALGTVSPATQGRTRSRASRLGLPGHVVAPPAPALGLANQCRRDRPGPHLQATTGDRPFMEDAPRERSDRRCQLP